MKTTFEYAADHLRNADGEVCMDERRAKEFMVRFTVAVDAALRRKDAINKQLQADRNKRTPKDNRGRFLRNDFG